MPAGVAAVFDDRIFILFRKAGEFAAGGRLADAADTYRAVLTIDPTVPEAHFNLGNMLLLQGLQRAAIDSYRQAIELRADYAPAYTNLGLALQSHGLVHEAIASFQQVVRIAPKRADAHTNLGNALQAAGRLAASCDAHRRAIACDPTYAEAHYNLGCALLAEAQPEQAEAAFKAAITLRPDFPQAYFKLGEICRGRGDLQGALEQFRRAGTPGPTCADALLEQGNVLLSLQQPQAAVECYRAALELRPHDPHALTNCGAALHLLGDISGAIACYQKAIGKTANHAPAWSNLGNAFLVEGEFRQAVEALREAVRLTPFYPQAYSNLGAALRDLQRPHEALLACETALLQQPDFAAAHHNRSLVLLTLGRLGDAWPEHEWRFRVGSLAAPGFRQPQWHGQDPAGQRILLHAEQGYGDTLQFVRYAPLLVERQAEVILRVQPPLRRLLAALPGITVISEDEVLPDFDLHCPLLSLPLAFGTELNTIPAKTPYLTAPPPSNGQVLPRNGRLRVGLVWAGSPRTADPRSHRADKRRSIKLAALASLSAIEGIQWISLQHGDAAREMDDTDWPMLDPMEAVTDFADTAALVAQLDLVISVDTAVAHLAGALGVPVWVLSRFDGCWRWLTDRSDSPWYPRLTLFRQKQPGNWAPVIAAVKNALAERARSMAA
jgi:tetratricopeptide (TPR) repeat protein